MQNPVTKIPKYKDCRVLFVLCRWYVAILRVILVFDLHQVDMQQPDKSFNLLTHLDVAHADLVPSFDFMSLTESGLLEDPPVLGTTKVKDTIKEDIPDKECIICFDCYEKGDSIIRLDCWCFFHEECIESWFAKKEIICCPVHNRETEGGD